MSCRWLGPVIVLDSRDNPVYDQDTEGASDSDDDEYPSDDSEDDGESNAGNSESIGEVM